VRHLAGRRCEERSEDGPLVNNSASGACMLYIFVVNIEHLLFILLYWCWALSLYSSRYTKYRDECSAGRD